MNRLFGYFSFQQAISSNLLEQQRFQVAAWAPDHEGHYQDKPILLTSFQRFITPECPAALMPYRNDESGCVIVADVYLTNRDELCEKLHAVATCADAELILLAYLTWDVQAPQYLAGEFSFALWNPRNQSLFLATDQFSKRPLLYTHAPGRFFAFANEMSPFRVVCSQLTINENMFAHFALDSLPGAETCYVEVLKILPGHQLLITSENFQQTCYWRLRDQHKKLSYRTRDEYYEAFREVFEKAVNNALRSPYPITSHISGGLDSSSVAAQAAVLLSKKQRNLYGFTALPKGLDGPSHRKGWYYHEMPRVQTLLDKYPNILHTAYYSNPETNIYEVLRQYYAYVDQPFRNVSNLDWILGSLEYSRSQEGRVLLTGARGNHSISHTASSWKARVWQFAKLVHIILKPEELLEGYFNYCRDDFLQSLTAKKILRGRGISFSPLRWVALLSLARDWSRNTSSYPLSLCVGTIKLDPTYDLNVVKFCYSVPDWVCREGKGGISNRLLVRRGLSSLLPEEIALNPHRGEQSADWFLNYNQNAEVWYAQLRNLCIHSIALLNRYYDLPSYAAFEYQFPRPLQNADSDEWRYSLMRFMSAAFFVDYLLTSGSNVNSSCT